MAEHPILFSTPMVCAILDGRKTQTRRVIYQRHAFKTTYEKMTRDEIAAHRRELLSIDGLAPDARDHCIKYLVGHCPFGRAGETLWVRETWRVHGGREYEYQHRREDVIYRADSDQEPPSYGIGDDWRPSIFMPRWASRITLRVKSVRVERLQEIGEADARAEGIDDIGEGGDLARIRFKNGWDSINGKRAPWASNAWVWAVEFSVVTP